MPAEPVILRGAPTTPKHLIKGGELERLWPLLLIAGGVMTVAGWADVALFWIPPRFGEADWEFGTISQTFDALPAGTLGLMLIGAGMLARGGSPWPVRALAIVFGLLALWVLGCIAIYALDLPQAYRVLSANPRIAPGLKRAIAKTCLFLVAYLAAYTLACRSLWHIYRDSDPLR